VAGAACAIATHGSHAGGPATIQVPAGVAGGAQKQSSPPMQSKVTFEPVQFGDLPGWDKDDHAAALEAFLKSCTRLRASGDGTAANRKPPPPKLASACEEAARIAAKGKVSAADAKRFFEAHFTPHRVLHPDAKGMLTAYYEPVIKGSRTPTKVFSAPVYRRPKDLVNLVDESERGAKSDQLTHARQTATGVTPYPTRAEIEAGALAGMGLELVYLESPVDVFFMQVQGSGRIALPDGSTIRITYDGKNGHPYTSVGRHLIERGEMAAEKVSLQSLESYLKADAVRGRAVMAQNASYVFFRELTGAQAEAPMGVMEIPLSEGRSLAVDTAHHAIGLPMYVSAPDLKHIPRSKGGFHRLMIAQDVGSAIKGPERGDIYVGSGPEAAKIAGVTKHAGNFYALLPADWSTLIEATADAGGMKAIRQASQ
jgi:membrane-bound lytic murein transglycosylase A